MLASGVPSPVRRGLLSRIFGFAEHVRVNTRRGRSRLELLRWRKVYIAAELEFEAVVRDDALEVV